MVLMHIGEHEKVEGPGWKISAAMVAPSGNRKGYRGFKVTAKKGQ